ncbi:type I-E CRISPR-associated protein Cas5/CasD [Streptomyces sp. RY43-2]|uniref:Type I-E CRISPR-associated protein Cas5/CasD n=1 Tax=Streptomyces macrolidinus TaxID=2952607 RepID=A0ABT0ZGJ0_9ACTN|nr:type I-E CRISPR-associated protein Cas5/CasD [Streptomyces macrolidinus]MCN9242705.1 type I-E CRISPR-associated protein Cas5/CasD [Streptomyces macrolidinus]
MSTPTTEPAATAPPEPGLLLHLSGPLQSWGRHSHFNQRDTAAFPTRSGIIGLLAAAVGRCRGEPIDDLAHLRIAVRVDRPGVLLRDLHTVGGGLPPSETVTTAEGKKRSGKATTLLSHRYYLADAAFTVAITSPPDTPAQADLLQEYAGALNAPRWPLYLGRRACPPTGPLLLGTLDNALHHLVHLPIAATAPRSGSAIRAVEVLAGQPLDQLPLPTSTDASDPADAAHPTGRINDQPTTFHPRRRTHQTRPLYRRTFTPPPTQWGGLGTDYLTSLATYLNKVRPTNTREGSHR